MVDVALEVERSAGTLWIIVPLRQGFDQVEPRDVDRVNARTARPDDHAVGRAPFNDPNRLAQGEQGRRFATEGTLKGLDRIVAPRRMTPRRR